MEEVLHIDENLCIRCQRCVRICTVGIFGKQEDRISIVDPDSCIGCGHCADVCPVDAIRHPLFPPEKLHTYSPQELPDPKYLLTLMKARRSNRAFSSREIPDDFIRKVVEAAGTAPTARNTQNISLILVRNPELLHRISMYTIDTFAKVANLLENPLIKLLLRRKMAEVYGMLPKFKKMQEDFYTRQQDPILRNAKAVLFFCAPEKSRFGSADSNLAYQNASLMAASLGLAHFYTGFVLSALEQGKKDSFYSMLGMEGKRIHAGMAMAMPAFEFSRFADRKVLEIKEL